MAAGMSAVCYPSEASTEIIVKHFKTLKPSHLGMKSRNSVFRFGGFVVGFFFLHFTKVPVCNELEILKKKKKKRPGYSQIV